MGKLQVHHRVCVRDFNVNPFVKQRLSGKPDPVRAG